MMMINRIQPLVLLPRRLDADYYAPTVIANHERLLAFGSIELRELIDTKNSGYGTLPPSDTYLEDGGGVPMIRGGDLSFGSIRPPEVRVPASFACRDSVSRQGDILLLIKGACIDEAEGVGLVPAEAAGFVFNGSCYRITASSIDSGFLTAYFLSPYFLLQKRREIANTGISYNAEESVLSYLVPGVSWHAQRYIGDKVRQAERFSRIAGRLSQYALRVVNAFMRNVDLASDLERLIGGMREWQPIPDTFLSPDGDCLASHSPVRYKRPSRVPLVHLMSRLDCNFYCPQALEIDEQLKGYHTASLKDIVDPSRQITNGVRGPDLQPSPFKLVRLQDREGWSIDFDRCLSISQVQFQENRRCELRERDVVVAIGGYIGHAAIVRRVQPAVIGQHSAVLPMGENSGMDEGFLVAYLSSHNGAVHLQRYVSGTVQAGINLEDLRDVRIPVPTPGLQRHIGNAVRRADDLNYWSTRLRTAASRFVEALVEGKVTEDELIDAHSAEQRGDRTLDVGLLSRLTKTGIDGPGQPPLIVDLGAFFAAIEENECIESSNGDVP